MIEYVSVDNFRAFSSLEVDGLKRVNVIVGGNSSGKSSFLEALFLSSSSSAPGTVFQIRAIRKAGGGTIQAPTDVLSYKSLWEDVFYDFDTNLKINIRIKGSGGDQRNLAISFKERTQQEIRFGKQASLSVDVGGLPQIVFVWKRGGGKEIVVKPVVTNTGLQLGNITMDVAPMLWFTPGAADSAEETAKRFSALNKKDEARSIVEALRREFDFIEDLSIEFLAGVPMVFATVRGRDRKFPLGLLSDGINRLMSILVGIAYFKDGVVLIDQIEDGFYFSHFESIWKVLHAFAVNYNVQLFITTHSRECIEALRPVLEEHSNDFGLLRAERQETRCVMERFNGRNFLAALEEQVEIR